jgi:hypothetical protein
MFQVCVAKCHHSTPLCSQTLDASFLCWPQDEQFSKVDLVLVTQIKGQAWETDKFKALQMYHKVNELVQDKLVFVCTNTFISMFSNIVEFICVLKKHSDRQSCQCIIHQNSCHDSGTALKVKYFFLTLWQICTVIVEITNTMDWFVSLLYSIYWPLHISAIVCHHQGASYVRLLLKHVGASI